MNACTQNTDRECREEDCCFNNAEEEIIHVMYCYRPREVEICDGWRCLYDHRWETKVNDKENKASAV